MSTVLDATRKKVVELHVRCSLTSLDQNQCGHHATTAVEMTNGMKMWRCFNHRGLRDLATGEHGPIHTEVVVKNQ